MGYEERKGKSYYYAKERAGGRVASRYIGAGDLARFVEMMETSRREERACYREADRLERGAMERADRDADELFAAVDELTEAVLLAAGFHRHKRQWRKKRCPKRTQ